MNYAAASCSSFIESIGCGRAGVVSDTPPRGQPMLPVRGVVSLLGRGGDEDKVLVLIEDGSLRWAWDLSLDPGVARRKTLRVLPACVDDFRAGRICALDWDEVIALVLPHDCPIFSTVEVQQCLNISQTHCAALLSRGEFDGRSNARRGPGGSALVTRSSLVDFLKRRCWPMPLVDS